MWVLMQGCQVFTPSVPNARSALVAYSTTPNLSYSGKGCGCSRESTHRLLTVNLRAAQLCIYEKGPTAHDCMDEARRGERNRPRVEHRRRGQGRLTAYRTRLQCLAWRLTRVSSSQIQSQLCSYSVLAFFSHCCQHEQPLGGHAWQGSQARGGGNHSPRTIYGSGEG